MFYLCVCDSAASTTKCFPGFCGSFGNAYAV
jgi:hypothetical protein